MIYRNYPYKTIKNSEHLRKFTSILFLPGDAYLAQQPSKFTAQLISEEMFYSQSQLSRKGPLKNIWLAAFCFNKLKKKEIVATNLTSSIEQLRNDEKMSYRLLARLLFGIVKIFSKQVDYLYQDCTEALINIRRAFIDYLHDPARDVTSARKKKRSAEIEPELMLKAYNDVTITRPECFELDAFDLGISDEEFAADNNIHHDKFILEEDMLTQNSQDNTDEYRRKGKDVRNDYSHFCLIPIDDVIDGCFSPSYMREADLEISKDVVSGGLTEELENPQSLVSTSEDLRSLNEPSKNQVGQQEVRSTSEYSQHIENHKSVEATISESYSAQNEQAQNQELRARFQEEMQLKVRVDVTNFDGRNSVGVEESNEIFKQSGDLSLASPQFVVMTPAKAETSRISRKKRKQESNLSDYTTIVVKNDTLKIWIDDPRDLVRERRKVPLTLLNAWKVRKFKNLQDFFTEPLIPYIPSMVSGRPEESTTNTMTRINRSEGAKADTLYEEIANEPDYVEKLHFELDLMDQDTCSSSNDKESEADGWSTRTREVAQYLCRRFSDQNNIRSLNQILDRQSRQKSARFFYETLTLKNYDLIDVKQERAYGDIAISPTPKLKNVFS